MAISTAATPRFEMGRVVKRTFSVIGHNIVTFFVLALIPGVALGITSWISDFLPDGETAIMQFNVAALAWFGAVLLVYLFTLFVLQAAVTHGTVTDLNGKRAALGNCLATGIHHFVPLFLIALLVGLGVMVGFVLLIVPGIMVAVAWSVAVPARVVEHTNVLDSISRSNDLTSGHRWPIFGLMVVYFIFQVIVGMIFGAYVGLSALTSPEGLDTAIAVTRSVPYIVGSTIESMVSAVVAAAGVASIYYELRVLKDGIGPEALASVFD